MLDCKNSYLNPCPPSCDRCGLPFAQRPGYDAAWRMVWLWFGGRRCV